MDCSWSQCSEGHAKQNGSTFIESGHSWTKDVLPGIRTETDWTSTRFFYFLNSGEVQKIQIAWGPIVSFLQTVINWGAMSSAAISPLGFNKSIIYQDFMIPFADKVTEDSDFIFQLDLAPAHTTKSTNTWFDDEDITVLNVPANWPDPNQTEKLWSFDNRKMSDTRDNNADELRAVIKASRVPGTPRQCRADCCHQRSRSCNRNQTKYRVQILFMEARVDQHIWLHFIF